MRVTPSSGTSAFLKDIPPDKIQRLLIQDEWYLDDFGGVEDAVVGGLRGEDPDRRTQRPQEPRPPETAPGAEPGPESGLPPLPPAGSDPNARPEPAPPGPGSPDGGPGSPGRGVGSPDGPPR